LPCTGANSFIVVIISNLKSSVIRSSKTRGSGWIEIFKKPDYPLFLLSRSHHLSPPFVMDCTR
jgi:hypothetical protein